MTQSNPAPAKSAPISTSTNFSAWLQQQKVSLAVTTNQISRLILIGVSPNGQVNAPGWEFEKARAICATDNSLYLSSRYQIWRLENVASGTDEPYDKIYVPRASQTTGELDIHDIALADTRFLASHLGAIASDTPDKLSRQVVFVNTLFSCLATFHSTHSFAPLWKPAFISQLAPEDRCHLSGLAVRDGFPRYVTAAGSGDVARSWLSSASHGGIAIDIAAGEIIATGLSLPNSPRFHQGKLWLLNGGSGELGYIENGKFVPVTFCPGFVRGLTFYENYAIVGVSKPRQGSAAQLAFEQTMQRRNIQPGCGVMVVDLTAGKVIEWLQFEETISDIFSVAVIPRSQQAIALGLKTDNIARLITFPKQENPPLPLLEEKQQAAKNENLPLISVIMTAYNTEKYIETAITSVIDQTYPNWELIIWNNGSTDETPTIARHYAQQDKRIRLEHSPHQPYSHALPKACALARGKYMGCLDSDDKLAPTALQETVGFLENNPHVGMVYTNYIVMDSEGKPLGLGHRCQVPYSPEQLLVSFMTFHFRLLRREVFDAVGGIDIELQTACDYDLCLKISEIAEIRHLKKPLYYYRKNLQGISSLQSNRQVKESELAIKRALERRGLAEDWQLEIDESTGTARLLPKKGDLSAPLSGNKTARENSPSAAKKQAHD